MLPSPRRQIKQLKKTSNTSHDNRQILISASPITTHRSEICRTFLRGNPRAFIEKDRIMKMLKRVVRFSLSRCKWTYQKQNKCGILHFQKGLDEVTFTLTAPAKALFLLACGLCLLLIIPVIIPKKTCHFCHVNLFTCSLLL